MNIKEKAHYVTKILGTLDVASVSVLADDKETYAIFPPAMAPNAFAYLMANALKKYAEVSGVDTKHLLTGIQIELIPREEVLAKLSAQPKKVKAPKKKKHD